MSSISEFERNKPIESYRKLNNLIDKYRALSEDDSSESDEDVCSSQYIISRMITKEITNDLDSFREIFLKGE
jgi:hypothetical protein